MGSLARASQRASRGLERLLESAVIGLIIALTVVVVVAVVYRKLGNSLAWYDEVASIMLAWLTYYGSCLAALKRAHIGFDGIVRAVPPGWRLVFLAISETCVIAFFAILAWTGWVVLLVLEGDTLVSLPEISVQITQSVMPISAALFIVCELLSLPGHWRNLGQSSLEESLGDNDAGSNQGHVAP